MEQQPYDFLKNQNIQSTVYPSTSFKNFNEWIRYIYLESERRYREQIKHNNKIYKP